MGDNGDRDSENDPVESDFETAESDSVSHNIVLTAFRVTFELVHMGMVVLYQMPCMYNH